MGYWPGEPRRYVEPFAGSACLFFGIQPAAALLSDANPHLIRTYRALKENPQPIYDRLVRLPRQSEFYYNLRPTAFDTDDDTVAASNFLYLNRNCFNGLYRTNKSGRFNVPFSSSRTGNIPTLESFMDSCRQLRHADFLCADFEDVLLHQTTANDFVYLDPPYAAQNERIFTQYGPDTFGTDDLKRLVLCLESLDERRIPFILSYADSEDSRRTFRQWPQRTNTVLRHIAGFSAHRRMANEILVVGHHTHLGAGEAVQ